ncbi:MAG: methyltransferase domain-containing protein [Bacteroidia bacterium]
MSNQSSELEHYWSQRYENQSTGWDLGAPSEPLKQYADQLDNKSLRILIPGAGNAYEAEYLFQSGFTNTHILDISRFPLENFQQRVPTFPSAQLLHGDFFELKDSFDLILEQTFFCSFPPVDNVRERYAQKMHQLLNPGGKLVGLWFNFPLKGDLTKRPFGGDKEEYLGYFEPYFNARTFEESHNSVPDRAGKELFAILEKR